MMEQGCMIEEIIDAKYCSHCIITTLQYIQSADFIDIQFGKNYLKFNKAMLRIVYQNLQTC